MSLPTLKKFVDQYRLVHKRPSEGEIREQLEVLYRERARDVAKRYTRGNVSIQSGDFLTREEIAEVLTIGGSSGDYANRI